MQHITNAVFRKSYNTYIWVLEKSSFIIEYDNIDD